MLTRRQFGMTLGGGIIAAGAGAFAQRAQSRIAGVRIGSQSYSFRDRPLDQMISAMSEVGLSYCELWSGHIETDEAIGAAAGPGRRDALRKWRLSVPLDTFKIVRQKFDKASIALTAYNLSFRDDFTDEEIARGFEMAQALGVGVVTASSNVTTAKKVDPFAKQAGIRVAFHNHSAIKPNEFATPDDFAAAMAGTSGMIAINLDIGHFTAANFDAVDYLQKNHARILSLHIKDRRRDQGENVPFGEGDTPIVPVLRTLRDNTWDIPAHIEYEYKGADAVAEVRRCYDYCRKALA